MKSLKGLPQMPQSLMRAFMLRLTEEACRDDSSSRARGMLVRSKRAKKLQGQAASGRGPWGMVAARE